MSLNPKIKAQLREYLVSKVSDEKTRATVISAYKMSTTELDSIKKKFLFLRSYSLRNEVDTSVLGGFIIKFNSKILDLSLKNQLNNFRKLAYESY